LRLEDIKTIEKQNTACVVPNALLVVTKENKKVVQLWCYSLTHARTHARTHERRLSGLLLTAAFILATRRQYFFTSLMHRDQTHDAIQRGMPAHEATQHSEPPAAPVAEPITPPVLYPLSLSLARSFYGLAHACGSLCARMRACLMTSRLTFVCALSE
jgi:hypothetical protein